MLELLHGRDRDGLHPSANSQPTPSTYSDVLCEVMGRLGKAQGMKQLTAELLEDE